MGRLEGKVAIVTGGSGGIGSTTVKVLAREGASVVVADLRFDAADAVAEEVRQAGGQAIGCAVDVSEENDIRAMIAVAVDTFGGLDVLHNNAAALGEGRAGSDVDLAKVTVEVWDRTFAVNVKGVWLGCKHAIPAMISRGGGSIINTSSGSGARGDVTNPAYGVSKGAVNTLTLYVATQYGKQGIRCNAISPGLILSHSVDRFGGQKYVDMLEEHHLTPRVGTPEDIANAAVFLASDESSFVTGQILGVDGGILSHAPTVADIRRMAAAS